MPDNLKDYLDNAYLIAVVNTATPDKPGYRKGGRRLINGKWYYYMLDIRDCDTPAYRAFVFPLIKRCGYDPQMVGGFVFGRRYAP